MPHQVRADVPPEHTAACVAALMTKAEPLAQKVRDGDPAADAALVPVVQSAFAYIGDAYKQGVRQAKADQMLKDARKAQAGLPADELAKRQATCQKGGEQLLDDANFIERALIVRAARVRMDKLVKHRPASAPQPQ